MTHDEAMALIEAGVPRRGETWADLGAGTGVFTRALADLLGADGVVHALDWDARVMRLESVGRTAQAPVHAHRGDFARPLALAPVDGILMANALHFAADHERVLRNVLAALRGGGTFLLVEYDLARGTPWIPHPIPRARLDRLAAAVGLESVDDVGRVRSRYGARDIYAACARKG